MPKFKEDPENRTNLQILNDLIDKQCIYNQKRDKIQAGRYGDFTAYPALKAENAKLLDEVSPLFAEMRSRNVPNVMSEDIS
jgi:hypothetical protein